jgi:CRISPR-associated endoribonuclease Cas6
MPTLIEMRLTATWSLRPDTRQLHGLACALFEGEAMAPDDHVGQEKPWAVAPLTATTGGSPAEWTWRAAWLPDSAPPLTQLDAGSIRAGHTSCLIAETSQRRVTRAVLAAGPGAGRVTVRFGSPTYFSRNGADSAVPDPRLIAGSWRRRWNASLPDAAPLVIGDDEWQSVQRSLGLAAFDLHTETRDSGHGKDRTGFVGEATLALARGSSPAARKLLAALARFAEYSGTGAQTTHGFGVTSLARPPGRQPTTHRDHDRLPSAPGTAAHGIAL